MTDLCQNHYAASEEDHMIAIRLLRTLPPGAVKGEGGELLLLDRHNC